MAISSEVILDMGIRLMPHKKLALYTAQSFEALGVICCSQSSGFATSIHPRSWCHYCRELLLEVVLSTFLAQVMQMDYS